MMNKLFAPLAALLTGCTSLSYSNNLLEPAGFSDLKGWDNQHIVEARSAINNSCQKLDRKNYSANLPLGSYSKWQKVCQQLARVDDSQLTSFFEKHFNVVQIAPDKAGLFTGYFSPVYEGRRHKEPGFETPLLKLPDGDLRNKSRAEIAQYIDSGKVSADQVLVWLKSPVDRFFLQIQGSGTIELKDGSHLYAGYAGNNGGKYVAIGRALKDRGDLKTVSMATIKQWLADNPEKQQSLFNENPRYIFFKETSTGAITAQGVPATAHHTLAVDSSFIPYGSLLWVDTTLTINQKPYRQLMVAQDTGSAIKGVARGDIYMGVGEQAGTLAGAQQAPGKLYALVPK
ncbi:murein transglycosylase A [Candidatus Sororendozoicomonas aggregata]|uniref:murein transglycosylase A n=1 Tax=Candidatus Sororendozoicomonas aggregata TaxID=3073239 RepID=UPI002ED54485